jgi:hypothetical protein
VVDFLADFGAREALLLKDKPDAGAELELLDLLVVCLADLGAVEHLPTIREWFAAGLVDDSYAAPADIAADIQRSPAELPRRAAGRRPRPDRRRRPRNRPVARLPRAAAGPAAAHPPGQPARTHPARRSQGRPQRPLPLRQRPQVQEMPRRQLNPARRGLVTAPRLS